MLSSPLENVIKVHHSFYEKLFNDFVLPQIMKYLSKSAFKINNLTSDKLSQKSVNSDLSHLVLLEYKLNRGE
jgi:hypothetical protein